MATGQYDFHRGKGDGVACVWKISRPQPISELSSLDGIDIGHGIEICRILFSYLLTSKSFTGNCGKLALN